MTLTAPPAMAQVNWEAIGGKTGPSTCPPGVTESRTTLMHFNAPSAGETSVTISNAATSRSSLGMWAGRPGTTSFKVALAVRDRNDTQVGRHNLGTITSTLSQQSKTFDNLKAGQRYAARIEVAPANTSSVIVRCFQMPPDLNRAPAGGLTGLGSDPLGATGCFAIGGVRYGGGDAAIRACFCGARHTTTGKWARTDAEDGYEYMLDATERTNRGCTTN